VFILDLNFGSNVELAHKHTFFMDFDSDSDTLLRVCKKCGICVLAASEPERFKNCVACRAEKRANAKGSNRKTSASSSTTLADEKKKSAKGLKKLEGKAKLAATKTTLVNGGMSSQEKGARKKKRGVQVFKCSEDLYDELRSEGMDACEGRYLLEFHGCFERVVQVGMVDNKEQVKDVAKELMMISLLSDV
jgi:hypothetical protein